MRLPSYLTLLTLLLATLSHAEPEMPITDFGMTAELLLSTPVEELREARALSVEDVTEQDRKAALWRIRELSMLETLKLYHADLSKVDEKDPIPPKVNAVLIGGCRISQGTLRWLAKFPSGAEITFGGCDLRKMDLDLGKFMWVMFDNCEVSTSAVPKLVKRLTQVTFKECTLTDDK